MNNTNETIIIGITLLFFALIFGAGTAVMSILRRKTRQLGMIEKIKQGGYYASTAYDIDSQSQNTKTGKKPSLIHLLSLIGKQVKSTETELTYSPSRLKFLKAGIRFHQADSVLWGIKLILTILLPFFFILLKMTVFKEFTNQSTIGFSVLLALFGFYLPNLWLKNRTLRRQEILLKGLPDALDLLVICVEAGLGVDEAFNRIAKELHLSNPILSDELNLLNLELRAGKSRKEALKNFAFRTDIEETRSFVGLLIQTDRFGTSVADAIKVYSDAFRTQRFQKAEEIAAKLPVRLLFPMILFIFPAIFIILFFPSMFKLLQLFSES